MKNVTEFIT